MVYLFVQTQNFDIYNIHEVIIQTQKNKLFSLDNKVPRTLFEARKLAGYATFKQSKTVWNCVILWGQFVSDESEHSLFFAFLLWLKCLPQNYISHL